MQLTTAIIVIGFVGGFVHHNDSAHREVQLADDLRRDYPTGVDVKIFENHAGAEAYQDSAPAGYQWRWHVVGG